MHTINTLTVSLKNTIIACVFFLLTIIPVTPATAQIRGLITQPATGTGQLVLDPNKDGYVSVSKNGFSANDIAESEIPYKPLPQLGQDPNSDLGPGPDCGFTDIVDQGTTENAISTYVDANNNLLFRFRLGSASPNSKGYSILIDTDSKFGSTGTNADPNYTSVNPGFEIEVVLRTNFGVDLNDIDGRSTPLTKTTISYTDYSQKAVAYTLNCGDYDYFYDFYIPISTITTYFPTFSTSTPLRMVGTTVIAPASALTGPISDIGGVNDATYANNAAQAWTALVNNFVPTTLSGVKSGSSFSADRSDAPVLNATILSNATSISGTSTEAVGSAIDVYKNGVLLGSTTVLTGGTFTLSGITVAYGDKITVTAKATNESVSLFSSEVIVGGSSCSAPPTIDCSSQKGFVILAPTGAPVGTIIRVYRITPTGPQLISSGPTTTYVSGGKTYNTYTYKCNNNTVQPGNCNNGTNCVVAGSYYFTAQENGKCESVPSAVENVGCTSGTAPTISVSTATALSGTTNVAGQTITVRLNDVLLGNTVSSSSPTTAGGSLYAYSYPGFSATAGQVVSVRGIVFGGCVTATATATITGVAAAPVITTTTIATNTTSISGTSTEADGSVITIYKNGVAIGTATVFAGVWTLNAPVSGFGFVAGDAITARVTTATNKTASVASNSVTVSGTTTRIPTITGPVSEAATSVSGTSTSPVGTVIKLYLDGDLIGQTTVVYGASGNTWSVTNLDAAYKLYPGGALTATATEAGLAESSPSTKVIIQCVTPLNNKTVTASNACQNSTATVTITNPESTVLYRVKSGATYYSSYAVAQPGAATLVITTDVLPTVTTLTLTIEAMKIAPTTCSTSLSTTPTINVYGVPSASLPVSAASSTICSGNSTNINVSSSVTGISYQLRNGTSNVGGAVNGTGNTISLPTGNLTATTIFNVLATNSTSGCSTVLSTTPTVTVNAQEKTVSAVNSTVCAGGSTTIQVLSSENGTTYQLRIGTTNVGSAVASASEGSTISLPSGTINSTTTFNVVATKSGCTTVLASQPIVTVGNPASRTVSATSTSICNGSSSTISLVNSESGVTYQLRSINGSNRTNIGSAVFGTGSASTPITLGTVNPTATTMYDVLATRTTGGCTTIISGPTITVNLQPTNKTVSGPGSIVCSGASTNISVASSESGVNYQLRIGTTNVGSAVAGTGVLINLPTGALTASTTYNVLATAPSGGCSLVLSTTPTVTVNSQKNVSAAASTLCSGGQTFITVEATEIGVTYELYIGATKTNEIAGDGGTIGFPTGALTTTTTYTVKGVSGTCTTQMTTQPTVTIANPSAALTVSAPASVCSGNTANISVAGSETGVSYQLQTNAGVNVGSPINGTGSTILLPTDALTSNTTFRIIATRLLGTCSTTLSATPAIAVNPNPVTKTVAAPAGNTCYNNSALVTVSNAQANVNYVLRNGTIVIDTKSGTAGSTVSLNTGVLISSTTFNVVAISSSGCSTSLGNVLVPVSASEKNLIAELSSLCAGGSTNILVELSESNVSYQLRNGTTNIGNPVTGNGAVINLPTGTINSTTTFNVLAINGTCTTALSNTPTITITTPTTSNPVTAPSSVCSGSTANIVVAASQSGVNYQLRIGSTNVGSPVSGTGADITLTTGTITSNTTFNILATNASSGCAAQLATTPTIEADCEAVYSPSSKTYPTGYNFATNESIATVSDADGFDPSNTSTAVITSGTLPAGIGINGTTGELYVSDANKVVASTVTLGIRTTDKNGKITDHLFALTINNPGPPLPVAFISFDGKLAEGKVELWWATAWEVNNDYYTIERSADGIVFQAVGTKKGAGNSSEVLNYSFIDASPLKGISYYRIKQTDFNGEYDYSKTIVIRQFTSVLVPESYKLYPNPVINDVVNINITNLKINTVYVSITDVLGKTQLEKYVTVYDRKIAISVSDNVGNRLKPGLYTLKVIAGNQVIQEKLIIK